MARDDFNIETKRRLAKRAGHRCAFPNCDAPTEGPSDERPEATSSVGTACHIAAASKGGRRFDPTMTPEQRKSIENGIWMCRTHGKLIDDDAVKFPSELLKAWKRESDHRAGKRIGVPSPQTGGGVANENAEATRRTRVDIHDLLDQAMDALGGRELTLFVADSLPDVHQIEKANRIVTKAETLLPGDPMVMRMRALILHFSGRDVEALELLERAAQVGQGSAEEAKLLTYLGIQQMRMNLLNEPLFPLQKAVGLDKHTFMAQSALGLALLRRGEVEAGLRHCERAVLLAPRSVHPLLALGAAYGEAGRHISAAKEFKKALLLEPKNFVGLRLLGLALILAAEPAEAGEVLLRAEELAPNFHPTQVDLGHLSVQEGKYEEGLAYFERAVELDPSSLAYLAHVAATLNSMGRYAETLVRLSKVELIYERERPPTQESEMNAALIHQARGIALTKLGRTQEASAEFKKAKPLHDALRALHSSP